MKQYAFDKSKRLTKRAHFQSTYRRGRSCADGGMVLIVARSRGKTRVGFSVGKKVGNSVVRNRARRLLRESYRLIAPEVRDGFNLIFVGRASLARCTFVQVQRSMRALLTKGGCLKAMDHEKAADRAHTRV